MCQWIAFVVRPYCSSTSSQSSRLQPWPPCSTACRPPLSPASIAARLTSAIVSSGSRPPRISASSSSGMRTSSAKALARACTSRPRSVVATASIDSHDNILLTTRSTQMSQMLSLDLDPRDVALTLQPVERATMLPPGGVRRPGCPRLGARPDLPRLDLRRSRLRRGRARQVPRCASSGSTASSSSAATTARPRAFLNVCRHRGARIVEEERGSGPQAPPLSVPRLVVRPRRRASRGAAHGRASRTSTTPATGCSRSGSPSSGASC